MQRVHSYLGTCRMLLMISSLPSPAATWRAVDLSILLGILIRCGNFCTISLTTSSFPLWVAAYNGASPVIVFGEPSAPLLRRSFTISRWPPWQALVNSNISNVFMNSKKEKLHLRNWQNVNPLLVHRALKLLNSEKYGVRVHLAQGALNPLTPMSDQDIISPYNINTISSRQVIRIKANIS